MSKESTKTPQVRPRLLDKIDLAMSVHRHVDGIWIGSLYGSSEQLTRVEGALSLIRQHSPLHYTRIVRELDRIWIKLTNHGVGEYRDNLKACILDDRYIVDSTVTVEHIASTIVHEATHARIERHGIKYNQELRTRIEAVCFRREMAFAARLPNGAELQQGIKRCLDWCTANPDEFTDTQFRERDEAAGTEELRYLEAPDWLIRAALVPKPIIRRLKRGSPTLALAASVPIAIILGLAYVLHSMTPSRKSTE
jgi:hypothetical protein